MGTFDMRTTRMEVSVPPGRYWLGDPVNVLDDEMAARVNAVQEGVVDTILVFQVGDGVYMDESGHRYGVDSGRLGVVPENAVSRPQLGGQMVEFSQGVYAERSCCVLRVGPVVIRTVMADEHPCGDCQVYTIAPDEGDMRLLLEYKSESPCADPLDDDVVRAWYESLSGPDRFLALRLAYCWRNSYIAGFRDALDAEVVSEADPAIYETANGRRLVRKAGAGDDGGDAWLMVRKAGHGARAVAELAEEWLNRGNGDDGPDDEDVERLPW